MLWNLLKKFVHKTQKSTWHDSTPKQLPRSIFLFCLGLPHRTTHTHVLVALFGRESCGNKSRVECVRNQIKSGKNHRRLLYTKCASKNWGMLVKVAELSGYRWKWFLWHLVKLLLCINRSVLAWKFIAEKLFTTFVGHKRWAPEVDFSVIAWASRKSNLNNKRGKTIFQSP